MFTPLGLGVAQGDQAGVFDLSISPHQGQLLSKLGKQFLSQLSHAVNIEQGAVSIESDQ